MDKPTLQEVLKPYGINSLRDFTRVGRWKSEEHARRVYRGERPLSVTAARRIKRKTRGALTLDYLLDLAEADGKGKTT